MSAASAAVLAFALLPALAGCLSVGPDQSGRDAWFGFSAVIVVDGSEEHTNLTFGGPVSLVLPDGKVASHFIHWGGQERAGIPPRTWYLDGRLRTLAVQDHCGGLAAQCGVHTRWVLLHQGQLAPFGIGWLALLQRNDLVDFVGYGSNPVQVHHATSDNQQILSVEVPGETRVGYQSGDWYYQQHQMLPSKGAGFRLIEYSAGEPLAPAWERPWPDMEPARVSLDSWFAGDSTPLLGTNTSMRQIVAAIAPTVEPGENVRCLRMFTFTLRSPSPSTAPPVAATIANGILVVTGNDGERIAYDLERDLFGREEAQATAKQPVGHGKCPDSTLAPPAVTSVEDLLARRQALGLTGDRPVGVRALWSDHAFHGWTAETDWLTLEIILEPGSGRASAFGSPFVIGLEASTGRLAYVEGHVSDDLGGLNRDPPVPLDWAAG